MKPGSDHGWRRWMEAARPRTLPAAVAPVLVGTAAAERFVGWRFAAALAVALAIQVAVNYANDYFDAARGVDTAERVGPRRAVASGLICARDMRVGIAAALGTAAVAGLALAVAAGWELLVVGLACLAAALAYSGGPRPYASAGLGEAFVFVFFGLVATVGSQYVQDEQVAAVAVVAAVPVGLLATAILVVNNLRDIGTDATAGKRTLAVRLGERATRMLYVTLVGAAFAWVVVFELGPPLALIALIAAVRPVRDVIGGTAGADLVPALGATALLHLAFGALLAVGLMLA